MEAFSTQRLSMREFTKQDAPFLYSLMNSEGWLQYIGNRNINSLLDAESYLKTHYLGSYKQHGFGAYVVMLKEHSTPIGNCGLYKRDTLSYPDLGFAFLPDYFGKGYAFEAAQAVVKYASEILELPKLYAITLHENQRSIHLLEKLAFRNIGETKLKSDGEELLLFSKDLQPSENIIAKK
ncbi:GNAT family N-acetyltransferase [Altibacter sp.]|uniref:GNAT family N-acetyltransferase n=1 Tax=Altibacter sp. TaxID=2024823 RepID=UPI000C96D389|nr:GNAT family N-acetyltransferase [Altibacter sp.]MAP54076.1 RimJ/RimL family protein N-acetyltransferase [Altibacter sp.]